MSKLLLCRDYVVSLKCVYQFHISIHMKADSEVGGHVALCVEDVCINTHTAVLTKGTESLLQVPYFFIIFTQT